MMENFQAVALIGLDPEPVLDRGQILFQKFEQLWLESTHCELSIILGMLEYARGLHHVHHWISKGDSFYGDHLMFTRLYDAIAEEIDLVAEKAVGVSTTAAVEYSNIIEQVGLLDAEFGQGDACLIPDPSALSKKSLEFEKVLLEVLQLCVNSLEQKGELSLGIDNLLAAIYDTHEGHIYLLKQRISSEFS